MVGSAESKCLDGVKLMSFTILIPRGLSTFLLWKYRELALQLDGHVENDEENSLHESKIEDVKRLIAD